MQAKNFNSKDLVTLDLPEFLEQSNTYRKIHLGKEDIVIAHPLAPEVLILVQKNQLNKVNARLKSPFESCLEFCHKHFEMLSRSDKAELDGIVYHFVIKKFSTNKQKAHINSLCGKIGSQLLNNSLKTASSLILSNLPLLDEHNQILFNNYEKVIKNPSLVKRKSERFVIYELAGMILAQQ